MGANVGGIHALHYKAASMYGFLITSCWCVAIGLFSHQNNMRRKVTISLPSGSFATTYLKDRYTHTHTPLPFTDLLPKMPATTRPGSGQSQELGIQSGSTVWVAETQELKLPPASSCCVHY